MNRAHINLTHRKRLSVFCSYGIALSVLTHCTYDGVKLGQLLRRLGLDTVCDGVSTLHIRSVVMSEIFNLSIRIDRLTLAKVYVYVYVCVCVCAVHLLTMRR